jgi:hypothetical protein
LHFPIKNLGCQDQKLKKKPYPILEYGYFHLKAGTTENPELKAKTPQGINLVAYFV